MSDEWTPAADELRDAYINDADAPNNPDLEVETPTPRELKTNETDYDGTQLRRE